MSSLGEGPHWRAKRHQTGISCPMFKADYADLMLVCGPGPPVPCHRVVLATRCGYFGPLLSRLASTETPSHHCERPEPITIDVGHIFLEDPLLLRTVLNFLYGRTKGVVNRRSVARLLEVADFLLCSRLVRACLRFLLRRLNVRRCLSTWALLGRFCYGNAENVCRSLARARFADCLSLGGEEAPLMRKAPPLMSWYLKRGLAESADPERARSFLRKYCSSWRLGGQDEARLLKAVAANGPKWPHRPADWTVRHASFSIVLADGCRPAIHLVYRRGQWLDAGCQRVECELGDGRWLLSARSKAELLLQPPAKTETDAANGSPAPCEHSEGGEVQYFWHYGGLWCVRFGNTEGRSLVSLLRWRDCEEEDDDNTCRGSWRAAMPNVDFGQPIFLAHAEALDERCGFAIIFVGLERPRPNGGSRDSCGEAPAVMVVLLFDSNTGSAVPLTRVDLAAEDVGHVNEETKDDESGPTSCFTVSVVDKSRFAFVLGKGVYWYRRGAWTHERIVCPTGPGECSSAHPLLGLNGDRALVGHLRRCDSTGHTSLHLQDSGEFPVPCYSEATVKRCRSLRFRLPTPPGVVRAAYRIGWIFDPSYGCSNTERILELDCPLRPLSDRRPF